MDFLSTLWNGFGNAAKGAGKAIAGAFNPAGSAMGAGQNLGQSVMNLFNVGNSAQNPSAMAPRGGASFATAMRPMAGNDGRMDMMNETMPAAKKSGGFGKTILDLFSGDRGKIGAGIASNLAGQAFAPKVNMPDINGLESVQNLRNFNGNALPTGVEDSINRSVDIQNRHELKSLQDTYRNTRPGTDYETDSTYQRDLAELERKQTLNRADAQSGALLQFNNQELGRLQELAQTDVYNIMIKLGMDSQEAEDFKSTFSNVGSMFLQSGLGLDKFKIAH